MALRLHICSLQTVKNNYFSAASTGDTVTAVIARDCSFAYMQRAVPNSENPIFLAFHSLCYP